MLKLLSKNWLWATALALILLIALSQVMPGFAELQRRAQTRSVPQALLATGRKGEILRKLGVIKSSKNNYLAFSTKAPRALTRYEKLLHEKSRFQIKERTGAQLFSVKRDLSLKPEIAPVAVPEQALDPARDELALSIDPYDLKDSVWGILSQPIERGKQWQRPIYLTYYHKGKLALSSGAGITIHGDYSRYFEEHKSFRLLFTENFSSTPANSKILFDNKTEPASSLILQYEGRHAMRFMSPIAMDLARQVFPFVPQVKPIRLWLNGELQGLRFLTEHIHLDFMRNHFGPRQFTVYRIKSGLLMGEISPWLEELAFLKKEKALSFSEAQARYDMENLIQWYATVIFCKTTDVWQGPALKETSSAEKRWFWIPWDLDESFDNPEFDSLAYLLQPYDRDIRSIIFRKLYSDRAFQRALTSKLETLLSEKWTPTFLDSLVSKYRSIAQDYDPSLVSQLERYSTFFKKRPDQIRQQLRSHFPKDTT